MRNSAGWHFCSFAAPWWSCGWNITWKPHLQITFKTRGYWMWFFGWNVMWKPHWKVTSELDWTPLWLFGWSSILNQHEANHIAWVCCFGTLKRCDYNVLFPPSTNPPENHIVSTWVCCLGKGFRNRITRVEVIIYNQVVTWNRNQTPELQRRALTVTLHSTERQ